MLGKRVDALNVAVESVSDDRGILGLDEAVPAGPLSMAVRVRLTLDDGSRDEIADIVRWATDHCPVVDAVRRAVPLTLDIES